MISQLIEDELTAILRVLFAQGFLHNGVEVIEFLPLQSLLELQLLLLLGLLFHEIQNPLIDLLTVDFVEGIGVWVVETPLLWLLFKPIDVRLIDHRLVDSRGRIRTVNSKPVRFVFIDPGRVPQVSSQSIGDDLVMPSG